MAKRMEDGALSFHDCLVLATKSRDKLRSLREADYHLERLKVYNRLALKLRLANIRQYEHLARGLVRLRDVGAEGANRCVKGESPEALQRPRVPDPDAMDVRKRAGARRNPHPGPLPQGNAGEGAGKGKREGRGEAGSGSLSRMTRGLG
jgi:hypothetical protein